jgi:hypothetical protein
MAACSQIRLRCLCNKGPTVLPEHARASEGQRGQYSVRGHFGSQAGLYREARRRKPSECNDAVSPYSTGIMRSGVSLCLHPGCRSGPSGPLRPEALTLSSCAVSDLTSHISHLSRSLRQHTDDQQPEAAGRSERDLREPG